MGKGRYSWLTCNDRVLIDCDAIRLYISVWNSYAHEIYKIFSIDSCSQKEEKGAFRILILCYGYVGSIEKQKH